MDKFLQLILDVPAEELVELLSKHGVTGRKTISRLRLLLKEGSEKIECCFRTV